MLDLVSPVFTVRFPNERECTVDLSAAACPQVARELAGAMWQLAQVGGRVRSRSTTHAYLTGIRKFDEFLTAATEDPAQLTLADVTPQLLDRFEAQMYAHAPAPRTAFGYLTKVVALLRQLRDLRPAVLHPDMPARLRFVGRMPCPRPTAGADAYASQVATALRAACREQIRHAVRRITVEGPALLARGQDPRVGGWHSDANLLWEIHRRGVFGVRDYEREAGPDHAGGRSSTPGSDQVASSAVSGRHRPRGSCHPVRARLRAGAGVGPRAEDRLLEEPCVGACGGGIPQAATTRSGMEPAACA
ncbi:hypothetical protein ACFXG4_23860 [Nocardia sp. NPDC059246]|uniref:hypothetical protein n=1 Tax=unclassified Nocardia TaxID=2637762 RepID=UPI0036BAD1D7